MKKLVKISYNLKIIFFIIHFYFVFILIDSILNTKYVGPIFLIIYLLFVMINLKEMLSKKKRYKNDLIYNTMQIGLYLYLIIFSLRVNINQLFVNINTNTYFLINYIILSLLLLFIFIYNKVEFNKNLR